MKALSYPRWDFLKWSQVSKTSTTSDSDKMNFYHFQESFKKMSNQYYFSRSNPLDLNALDKSFAIFKLYFEETFISSLARSV